MEQKILGIENQFNNLLPDEGKNSPVSFQKKTMTMDIDNDDVIPEIEDSSDDEEKKEKEKVNLFLLEKNIFII